MVKRAKEKWGFQWFDEFSKNTIVLEREPGHFVFYDVEKESGDIEKWINKMSLKKGGDEVNRET